MVLTTGIDFTGFTFVAGLSLRYPSFFASSSITLISVSSLFTVVEDNSPLHPGANIVDKLIFLFCRSFV